MIYLHLTIDERSCIASMLLRHESISQIARVLKRNKSTISRELKRNFFWNEEYRNGYFAPLAQHWYRKRKKNCHKAANAIQRSKRILRHTSNRRGHPSRYLAVLHPMSCHRSRRFTAGLNKGSSVKQMRKFYGVREEKL